MKKIFNIKHKTILALGVAIVSSSLSSPTIYAQKVTGLNDFKLYLDPGHALKENQGLYNYSEAEKTVRVALAIRDYLQTNTDIGTIYMCREDDNKQISLTERTNEANALGVDFYYSIHSDAGTPETNSTLFMYGGWAEGGIAIEKSPAGGKAFGEHITAEVNSVMRIPTRGLYADRMYYDNATTHTNKYPYLHVNRESNMASLLSEAGYHTNPTQQQRNLNAEWKRMEGLAAFRSIVKYAGATCPDLGFLAGIITDNETGLPINGAKVSIAAKGKEYTTDTYESLFNKYSKKPDELRNGFYFIEGLNNGDAIEVVYSAPGFESITKNITISTNATGTTAESLNFTDVSLLNLAPAKVSEISAKNLDAVSKFKPLVITFSRKMDRASVENALSISPTATYVPTWKDDYTLSLDILGLDYLQQYTLTIDGSIAKNSVTNNFLDGAGNGTEGSNYVLVFTTAEQDTEAPTIVSYDPQAISNLARPIVRIQFSKLIEPSTIALDQIKVTKNDGSYVDGVLKITDVNKRTVLHYLFNENLEPETKYNVEVSTGPEDLYGNALADKLNFSFESRPDNITETIMIDNFTTVGVWWHPGASGSSSGLNKDISLTSLSDETYSVDSPSSLKMTYLWDENASLFRVRLYRNSKTPKITKDYVMQAYVFGDASGANFRLSVRDTDNGIKSHKPIVMDWAGWKLISWDMTNDESVNWLAGTNPVLSNGQFNFENVGLEPITKPTEFTPSFILVDDLKAVKVEQYVGIRNIENDSNNSVKITDKGNSIEIKSVSEIKDVKVYNLSGVLVKTLSPEATECSIVNSDFASGIYIVKVISQTAQISEKIVVR